MWNELSPLSRTAPLISYWGHGVVEWGYNSFYNNLSTFNTTFICSIYYLIMTSILTVALKAFENIWDKEIRNNDRNLDKN